MKNIKFVSLLSGITLLATSLFGSVASAATGSFSISSVAPQTNGTFTASLNVNSDNDFNYAEAHLSFSAPVQNVSLVTSSPFIQQDCGSNCVAGYIAGGNKVTSGKLATVSFTLSSPGSVSVSFDSGYVSHPNPNPQPATSINATGSTVVYTYNTPANAPVTGGKGGETPATAPTTSAKTATPSKVANNTAATPDSTSAAGNEPKAQVKGDSTTAATTEDDKKRDATKSDDEKSEKTDDAKNTSSKSGFWILAIIAIAAGFVLGRRAVAAKAAANARAAQKAATVAAATSAAAKKAEKASNKKNTKKAANK